MADDNSSMWGDLTGPLSNAFSDFSSNMDIDHLFSNDFLATAANGTIAAAKKAAKTNNPVATKNPYEEYFAHQATIGNFDRGHEPLGLDRGKQPGQTQAARSENPQEVYLRWRDNMKRFAYGS